MKSSGHKTVASRFVTFVGLSFALALGFFVVNQGSYVTKTTEEKVLGVAAPAVISDSYATTRNVVEKTPDGRRYNCNRTNCDQWVQNSRDSTTNKRNKCQSIRNSNNWNVCYWSNPTFTEAQCNVDKTYFRNRSSDVGTINRSILDVTKEDSENIVYWNCTSIAPTPTRIPTRRPTPTPNRKPTDPKPTAPQPTPTKTAPSNVR